MTVKDYSRLKFLDKPQINQEAPLSDLLEMSLCFTAGIAVCLVVEVLVALWICYRR